MNFRLILVLAIALVAVAGPAAAEISDGVIKIGVLNDQSSLYADLTGQGSVIAARMAVEDYGAAAKGLKVEIIFADHQNKADVGSAIARQWYDADKVDVIVDVPNSAVALAVNQVTRDKGRAFLVSGAASSDFAFAAMLWRATPHSTTAHASPKSRGRGASSSTSPSFPAAGAACQIPRSTRARAPTSVISRAEVRLGPGLGRSEAEAVSGTLRAPSDTARGGPRRASARRINGSAL